MVPPPRDVATGELLRGTPIEAMKDHNMRVCTEPHSRYLCKHQGSLPAAPQAMFLHVLADTLGSVGMIVSTAFVQWRAGRTDAPAPPSPPDPTLRPHAALVGNLPILPITYPQPPVGGPQPQARGDVGGPAGGGAHQPHGTELLGAAAAAERGDAIAALAAHPRARAPRGGSPCRSAFHRLQKRTQIIA